MKIAVKLKNLAIRLLARTRADQERELFGALHKTPRPLILVLGDSLVASSTIANGQSDVYNAGVGRSRISDVLALINRLKADRLWNQVAGMVVSCGLNDADAADGEDLTRRAAYFRSVVDALAIACQEKPLVLLTITEIGEQGIFARRFNRELLGLQNDYLRSLPDTFDMYHRFHDLCHLNGIGAEQMFTDGVHLSKRGYTFWTPLLNASVEIVRSRLLPPVTGLAA